MYNVYIFIYAHYTILLKALPWNPWGQPLKFNEKNNHELITFKGSSELPLIVILY